MDTVISHIGTGEDHSTIAIWADSAEYLPIFFNIGVLKPGYFEDHSFREFLTYDLFDFLLVTWSGKIIAWRVGEIHYFIEENINNWHQFEDIEPKYNETVKKFLSEHLGISTVPDKLIYYDEQFSNKIELVLPDFGIINEELMRYLAVHPEHLHRLQWRKFEELLDELFSNMGYETTLGPGRGDGGVDIRLIWKEPIGEMLTLVQAKSNNPKYPIKLQPVQALYGAVETERANKGILVSTSDFQPAAKKYVKNQPRRIELAGPKEIKEWLRKYSRRS